MAMLIIDDKGSMPFNIAELEDEEAQGKALAKLTIGDQIQELSRRLQLISEELHQQVREQHGVLLQQATHAGRFDTAISELADNVQRIRSIGQNLKSQVDSQYKQVENQTKALARLHELSHLLRSAGTLLTLTAKLRGTKHVLKQTEIYYELRQLIEDKDLKDIEFIQSSRAYVIELGQKIRNLTQIQLVTGLQERNVTQVVNALKIFINFNTLDKSLDNLVTTYISNLEQSLKECFAGNDISVLGKIELTTKANGSQCVTKSSSSTALRGPGKTPHLTTTQNFRAKFWKSMHWLLYDELYESCEQIRLLRSALEQISEFGAVAQKAVQSIKQQFWQAVQLLLRKSFSNCAAHVSQTLQEGLSKLISSARGLEQRLDSEFRFDNELFTPFEAGYISKCANNLKVCMAGVDLPNNETVDNFLRIAATELSAALIDVQLSNGIAAAFVARSQELCTKLEAQLKFSPDSKQVVDPPNTQQTQNIVVANVLFYYKDSTRRMLQDLQLQLTKSKTTAKTDILKSLKKADQLITTILQQIIDSIFSSISIIMLSMHREPGLNTEKISTTGPSMYMKELQEFLARSWDNHVTPFKDIEIVENCAEELAKRCIELFIHNLSILRPLSNAGRLRMKNDCMHLEQVLHPLCTDLAVLGKPARLLRAMSFLIVQSPQELTQQNTNDDSLVPSYLVFFLLFGHAGMDLQSPHTTVNWSNERLIEWLDGHTSEREKLEIISGALQRYRDSVRRKNSEQYDPVFPLMVEFFEKALSSNNE